MIIQLIIFFLVGLLIGYLAYFLFSPQARIFDPWGMIVPAIIGAVVGGLLGPELGIFAISFVSVGAVIMSSLFSTLFTWLTALIIMIISARPSDRNTISGQEPAKDSSEDDQ